MTEIELHQPAATTDLATQMNYAKAIASANLLPDSYRNKPADILIAVGLGQSMGLSPAESLYRISVIKGKPTASAELIAANVRKAGHKLRVRGDDTSATAQIVRADDPDYTFEVTRDIKWAEQMGLSKNDNYRKQPGTMLQWRAITAVARLACPEALYGVGYTPDEISETPGFDSTPQQPTGLAAALQQPQEQPAEGEPVQETGEAITEAQTRKIAAAMGDLGLRDRAVALEYVADVIGRPVESRNDLTKTEASQVIEALEADITARAADQQDVALPDPSDGEDPWAQ